MKKTLTGMMALLFIGVSIANAQSSKEKPPPPPPPPSFAEVTHLDMTPLIPLPEFYKKYPMVEKVSWEERKLVLKLKDGTSESFDLSDSEQIKLYKNKYGRLILPPPPPPPPKIVDEKIKMPPPPPPPKT